MSAASTIWNTRAALVASFLALFALLALHAGLQGQSRADEAGETAATLDAPGGPVLLTVTGSIAATNGEHEGAPAALLDRAALEALPQHTLQTSTEWTEGVVTFSGPLARDVLALVGGTGTTVSAVAVNEYAVDIPLADFDTYDVVLAMEMNGKALTLRDKGPIWIIYPRDAHRELHDALYNTRWVWQLSGLMLK